jgi:hypothetical protein
LGHYYKVPQAEKKEDEVYAIPLLVLYILGIMEASVLLAWGQRTEICIN